MKSSLLLLPVALIPVKAYSFGIKIEGSAYLVKLPAKYTKQVGYEKWEGKKRGTLYKLLIEEKEKIGRKEVFKLSITSGNTKAPYLDLFTGEGERLFNGEFKSFTVKELYFKKESFLLRKLSLKLGKQKFELGTLLNDYLWGGSLSYRAGRFKITWNQIAAYEGKYFLFKNQQEDDVDIFNLEISRKGSYLGFYWLSDAKGNLKAEIKKGVVFRFRKRSVELKGATQNGKFSGVVALEKGIRILLGYSQNGFTSYGFKEGVRDLGLIYKPTFSNLRFLKGELPFQLGSWRGELFALYLQKANGKFLGSEEGISVERPITKRLSLFTEASAGSKSSYALFSGIRYSLNGAPFKREVKYLKVKTKNDFTVKGEYADFSGKLYPTQSDYEDYAKARHLGFWHSTYKLSVYGKDFKLKVSTGKNDKVDYLVWGNTVDDYKYQKSHGKEWHVEEGYLKWGKVKVGVLRVKLKGFADDSLGGAEIGTGRVNVYGLLETNRDEEGSKPIYYLVLKGKARKGELFFLLRKGKRSTLVGGAELPFYLFKVGALLELKKGKDGWGVYLIGKKRVGKFKVKGSFRIYSKEFSSFGLKEYFWNEGYIYRPGEKDLMVGKLKVERKLNWGWRKLRRLKPKVSLIYLNLRRSNGRYVGEEGGVELSLKVSKNGKLYFIGTRGNNGSYYEGVWFKVSW